MVIHARGKTGVKHRRWGKMWVTMRYLSEDDDALTFSRVCAALEKHSVERHRVRYLLSCVTHPRAIRVVQIDN